MHTLPDAGPVPNRPTRVSNQTLLLLALVTLLGLALRLYRLDAWGLWYDEANTVFASEYVKTPLKLFNVDYVNDAPLLSFLVFGWRALLALFPGLTQGTAAYDFALRLLPCLFSAAAIPLVFFACRALLRSSEAGLIAAFLCAASPFQIFYAQELRNYAVLIVLNLAGVIFLFKALDTNRWAHWIAYSVFWALSVWNHFYSVWYILFINLFFVLMLPRYWRLLGRWIVANALVVLLSAPTLYLGDKVNQIISHIGVQWYPVLAPKAGLITFVDFFAGYTFRPALYWPLFGLAMALFLYGLIALRREPRLAIFYLALVVGPIASSIVLWKLRHFTFYQHRLFIFSGVLAYCVVAWGISRLRLPLLKTGAVAAFAGLMALATHDYYKQDLHPAPMHRLGVRYKVANRAAAQFLAKHAQPDAVTLHASHVTLTPFRYYLNDPARKQVHVVYSQRDIDGFETAYPNPALWSNWEITPVPIRDAVRGATNPWYVESWWEPFQAPPLCKAMRIWMDDHFLRNTRRAFYGITVYGYTRPETQWQPITRNRVLDYGDWTVPVYHLSESAPEAVQNQWAGAAIDSLINTAPTPPEGLGLRAALMLSGVKPQGAGGGATPPYQRVDWSAADGHDGYSVLAADAPNGARVFVSFPAKAAEPFSYQFVLVNPEPTGREIACSVYGSYTRLEALSFTRKEGDPDVWYPALRYDPTPPAGSFDDFSLVAHFGTRGPQAADLYRDAYLLPGQYRVFVYALIFGDPVNTARGVLEARVGPPSEPLDAASTVGIVETNRPGQTPEWQWVAAGEITVANHDPARVWVRAANRDGLADAYVDFGGLALVPVDQAGRDPGYTPDAFTLTLAPGETRTVTRQWPGTDWPATRLDVEAVDRAAHQVRRIFLTADGH